MCTAGKGVVEGGTIPCKLEALAIKREKCDNRLVADVYRPEVGDPELKCYLPGSPARLTCRIRFRSRRRTGSSTSRTRTRTRSAS